MGEADQFILEAKQHAERGLSELNFAKPDLYRAWDSMQTAAACLAEARRAIDSERAS